MRVRLSTHKAWPLTSGAGVLKSPVRTRWCYSRELSEKGAKGAPDLACCSVGV